MKAKSGLYKTSKALESWYLLSYRDFSAELAKKKITIYLKQENEWIEHFNEQRVKALALKDVIDATDKEIDRQVYALYNLNIEEIAVIEAENP